MIGRVPGAAVGSGHDPFGAAILVRGMGSNVPFLVADRLAVARTGRKRVPVISERPAAFETGRGSVMALNISVGFLRVIRYGCRIRRGYRIIVMPGAMVVMDYLQRFFRADAECRQQHDGKKYGSTHIVSCSHQSQRQIIGRNNHFAGSLCGHCACPFVRKGMDDVDTGTQGEDSHYDSITFCSGNDAGYGCQCGLDHGNGSGDSGKHGAEPDA